MGKKLSEMTLEELWMLFPIFLTEYRPEWKEWYLEQEALLREVLPAERVAGIHHIGSTAIGTIWAKPIVDILVEVRKGFDLADIAQICAGNGYRIMSRSPEGISLNKGYTEEGFAQKVYHLHIRFEGDNNELYFRDYLMEHPEIAMEYERMKLDLWKQYEHDRDGYTRAKSEFIQKYTRLARQLYAGRY